MYNVDIERDLPRNWSPNEVSLIERCNHPCRESLFDILDLLGISVQLKKLDSDIELQTATQRFT